MYLQASDEGSQHSGSEDFPIYEESEFNNKYLIQPTLINHQNNKYQNIQTSKRSQPIRFTEEFQKSSGLNTEPHFHQKKLTNQSHTGNREQQTISISEHQQVIRFRLLLEREIEKNRELEKQLFIRQKQLISIRTRQKPFRKSPPLRIASPVSSTKLQNIREFQAELQKLKSQISRNNNSMTKQKTQQLKQQNLRLKKQNKKYEQFVHGISMSLGILTKDIPPKGLSKTWKVWREVFKDVARQQKK